MRRYRLSRLVVVAAALCLFGLAACQPVKKAPPPLLVTTAPALFPSFQAAVIDYVNRCDPATPTSVEVAAPDGTTVSVAGAPAQGGEFSVQVPQAVGERFTIGVTTNGVTTTHHVRCLPTDFPQWSVEPTGAPQAAFYATVVIESFLDSRGSYPVIFDTNGVPVWWLDRKPVTLLTELPNKNLAVVGYSGMEEYELDGDLVRTVNTVGGPVDFHDVLLLPNGNYVLGTDQQQPCDLSSWGVEPNPKTCANHVFQELTPTGVPVWTWDTAAHIPVDETPPEYRHESAFSPGAYRPWHYNSIEDTGDGFIVSYRHLDAVYKIDKATGSIVWKLGGIPRPESLTLVGDALGGPIAQHDARLLADGTLSIHDNGSGSRPPRSVRYALDTTAKTATLVADLQDAGIPQSICCGSSRLLPGGNRVVGWGGTDQIIEYAPPGTRVFRLSPTGTIVYRATPLLPGEYTADEFRAAMDVLHSG